jgi:isopentenyl phosphate kinase
MSSQNLVFLKLGGSLITEKDIPRTPRLDVLRRLADEIQSARLKQPETQILLGHGSGSFGHVPARKYGTRRGVKNPQQWTGFVEVWKEARALNQIVIEILLAAGLPIIAFPPSSSALAQNGRVLHWDLAPIRAAFAAGLIPLVNGDTIFDVTLGGTILSTEDLFLYLARQFHPQRILLAGIEPGVWSDFPQCTRLLNSITPDSFSRVSNGIKGSSSVDVTGGMARKVESMLSLIQQSPGMEALIFSGQEKNLVEQALTGDHPGTLITIALDENRR